MNFFDHIMTRWVLACVFMVAALLTINGQDLNAVKKISMASVTVHDGMHGAPHILRGKNLSLLPYFASGRESISMCIIGNYSYYSTILSSLGFLYRKTLWLENYQFGNSSDSAVWDCTTEKNAADFKAKAADLLKNFQVNLFLPDPVKKYVHYWSHNGKGVYANRKESSPITLLTLRPERPTLIKEIEVELMWSLYFKAVKLNYVRTYINGVTWTSNNQLLTPALTIECKSGITINSSLLVTLEPRTPLWQFPLKGAEINLKNGSTIDLKEEEIFIYWQKERYGWGYHSFKDFIHAGRRFLDAHHFINMDLNVKIRSRVKCIKITFNDTLDMKMGEERLSIHKLLEPKEGEPLRVIYSLPSPLTERSEINMSVSPSHWLIEKISVIPASGDLSGNKSSPNTSVTNGENVDGIHGFQPTISTKESTQETVTSQSTREESTQEVVTSQYFRAGEDIGIACGVIIPLIAVIAMVIKKCRWNNRNLGSSDTQTADNQRVDTVDAGTKETCVEKTPERDVSHETVELEEKGFDKSTNNEAILASANTKAHSEFISDESTSRVTIPSRDDNSYEEENLIYGEF